MTVLTLMADLEHRQVRLWADGGRLEVDAPAGVLTAQDLNGLRLHKPEILNALADREESPPPAGGGPPSEAAPPPFDTGRFDLHHPWRRPPEIAGWSIDLRERFGRRANALADLGYRWPVDEMIAYLELTDPEQARAMLEAGPEVTPDGQ